MVIRLLLINKIIIPNDLSSKQNYFDLKVLVSKAKTQEIKTIVKARRVVCTGWGVGWGVLRGWDKTVKLKP